MKMLTHKRNSTSRKLLALTGLLLFIVNIAIAQGSWQQNGNDLYYDQGNVGIGTSAPQRRLDVLGTMGGAFDFMTQFAGSGGGQLLRLKSNDQFGANIMFSSDSRDWLIQSLGTGDPGEIGNFRIFDMTGSAIRFSITPSGNVGIGTTTPTARLGVFGMIESSSGGFKFPDGTVQTTATLQGPAGPQGSAGPQGPAGMFGMEYITGVPITIAKGETGTATAVCTPGKKVLSGGYVTTTSSGSGANPSEVRVYSSVFDGGMGSWIVAGANVAKGGGNQDLTLSAYAVCAAVL